MSDNVKIIIEIPKELHEALLNGYEEPYSRMFSDVVKNGIPLDSVKAEMEKHQFSREYCCNHNIDTAIDMGMVRIILDNIGKEESEEV